MERSGGIYLRKVTTLAVLCALSLASACNPPESSASQPETPRPQYLPLIDPDCSMGTHAPGLTASLDMSVEGTFRHVVHPRGDNPFIDYGDGNFVGGTVLESTSYGNSETDTWYPTSTHVIGAAGVNVDNPFAADPISKFGVVDTITEPDVREVCVNASGEVFVNPTSAVRTNKGRHGKI